MNHARKRTAVEVARTMPHLPHYVRGQPFDIEQSEVVRWLIRQPEVQQFIYNFMKAKGAIRLDLNSGDWIGADNQSAARSEAVNATTN
jgi:hypothetical protein